MPFGIKMTLLIIAQAGRANYEPKVRLQTHLRQYEFAQIFLSKGQHTDEYFILLCASS